VAARYPGVTLGVAPAEELSMSDPLVVVFTGEGRLEAERIRSWLEAQGIPAMVSQEGAGQVYGLTFGLLGQAAVLVPAARAAEAEALLADLLSGEPDSPAPEGDTPASPSTPGAPAEPE
jgi:hypothetical protein